MCVLRVVLLAALVACAAAHSQRAFQLEWSSFADIAAAVKQPQPTVNSSFGPITYKQRGVTEGSDVYHGYTDDGAVRSVLVADAKSAVALFVLTREGAEISLVASPSKFSIQREDTAADSHHHCGNHGDDDGPSASNKTVSAKGPFRPQSEPTTDDDAYTGNGIVLGKYWASFPFIRTYRLVAGSYKSYAETWEISKKIVARVEEMNLEYYERDLGIHLVLVANPISETDEFLKKGESMSALTRFSHAEVGVNNYETSIYIRYDKYDGGRCATGGVDTPGTKGSCFAYWGLSVMTHELGHLFGAKHSHVAEDSMEPGKGFSIMSYGEPRKLFNLGSVLQINEKFNKSNALEVINNTNARPQLNVNSSRLRPVWNIPHSTPFRFTIDANDPDEDDQLLYYVQQLNYDEAERKPSYRNPLLGKPSFVNPEVSTGRSFYYCTRYEYTKQVGDIVTSSSMTEDTYKYDMFANVFDSNSEKRNAFVNSYDSIVKEYTTQIIDNRNDEARAAELDAEMRRKLAEYTKTNQSWMPKRDVYHVKVIAHKNQKPFSVSISPLIETYYDDVTVTISWEYDDQTIPAGDHVTIRYSDDGLVSFPYVMKRHIPASDKSATFKVPSLPTDKGYFIVEHDEGIVFAHTNIGSNRNDKTGKAGAFRIRATDIRRTKLPTLTPSGPVIVKDAATLQTFLDKVKLNSFVNPVNYVLADEDGNVLGVYQTLSGTATSMMPHLQLKKGTYCKLVAVTGPPPTTADNVVDIQAKGYHKSATQFVSNVVEIKLYSAAAVHAIKEDETWLHDSSSNDDDDNSNNDDNTGSNNGNGNAGSNNGESSGSSSSNNGESSSGSSGNNGESSSGSSGSSSNNGDDNGESSSSTTSNNGDNSGSSGSNTTVEDNELNATAGVSELARNSCLSLILSCILLFTF